MEKEGSEFGMRVESQPNRPSGRTWRDEGKRWTDKSQMFHQVNRVDGDHFLRRASLEEEHVREGKSRAEFRPPGRGRGMLDTHAGRGQL